MRLQRGWRGHHRLDRLSCRRFAANAVRLQLQLQLQLHTLAHILGSFLRTLEVPDELQQWSMTTLRQRLARIGATAGLPGGQRETRVHMTILGRKPCRVTHHRSASRASAPLGSVSLLPREASDSYHQFCAGETDGHPENVRYARDAGLPGG
jgi:hypothetical protein